MSELQKLSDAELKVVETVKKILDLAARNPNEHEAAAARDKAAEMMAKHNLDVATVEANTGLQGKREEALVDGGFYAYQRDLWQAVAELHFCAYWNQKYLTKETVSQTHKERGVYLGMKKVRVMRRRHAMIGRVVNTRMTQVMAGYLQDAIEKALRAKLGGDPDVSHLNAASNWAHSYRKGAAARLTNRLLERRDERLAEEEAEAERALRKAKGVSTSTSLSLASFSKSEEAANYDYKHGEGAWQKRADRRARWAKMAEEEMAAATQWAKDNPEEAKKQQEEWEKREAKNAARRKGRRFTGWRKDGTDLGAYYAGSDDATKIGLDQQAGDGRGRAARLTGSKDIRL